MVLHRAAKSPQCGQRGRGSGSFGRRLTLSALAMLSLAMVLLPARTAAYTALTDAELAAIPNPGADFDIKSGPLLADLLTPRVPGTEGQAKAQRHLAGFFHQLQGKKRAVDDGENNEEGMKRGGWEIMWHNTTSRTPATGDREVPFHNLIVRRDPPWAAHGDVGRLTLVAHYDSKIEPSGFIGATDSAAPCAMLLHVARAIDAALTAKWENMERSGKAADPFEDAKGVQFLFLDGEEAFAHWTSTDSLYGARALAEHWEDTAHEPMSRYRNPLSSIELFVLLDLLGARNPFVPSYFENTHWAYQKYSGAESRMRAMGLLESRPPSNFLADQKKAGPMAFKHSFVEDDHIPFMHRGVPVLHVIPKPFPVVWHTIQDDAEHLDIPTVRDWAMITTAFVAEYLDLQGFMPKKQGSLLVKRGEDCNGKSEL